MASGAPVPDELTLSLERMDGGSGQSSMPPRHTVDASSSMRCLRVTGP